MHWISILVVILRHRGLRWSLHSIKNIIVRVSHRVLLCDRPLYLSLLRNWREKTLSALVIR